MSRRKLKIAKRKAAQLHSLRPDIERLFAELEQGKPTRAEIIGSAPRTAQDAT